MNVRPTRPCRHAQTWLHQLRRRLSSEDRRNIQAARKSYAVPRFQPIDGRMSSRQWRSWLKLRRLRLAAIEPNGGEAECLVLTWHGRRLAARLRCSPKDPGHGAAAHT